MSTADHHTAATAHEVAAPLGTPVATNGATETTALAAPSGAAVAAAFAPVPPSAATWRAWFANWPADLPRRGVLVTSLDEQIPFANFMASDSMLFVERRNPDTVGARYVLVAFDDVRAVKFTDVVATKTLAKAGFIGLPAKK